MDSGPWQKSVGLAAFFPARVGVFAALLRIRSLFHWMADKSEELS